MTATPQDNQYAHLVKLVQDYRAAVWRRATQETVLEEAQGVERQAETALLKAQRAIVYTGECPLPIVEELAS